MGSGNNFNGIYFHHHFCLKTGVSRNGLSLGYSRYKQGPEDSNAKSEEDNPKSEEFNPKSEEFTFNSTVSNPKSEEFPKSVWFHPSEF